MGTSTLPMPDTISTAALPYPRRSEGDVKPSIVIGGPKTGLIHPAGIALDIHRDIYVINNTRDGSGSVLVYRAGSDGNVAPFKRIDGSKTGLNRTAGIALDRVRNIYVTTSEGAGTIAIFRHGSAGNVAPARMIDGSRSGLEAPQGIKVDNEGTIYVANVGSVPDPPAIDVAMYSAGSNGCVTPVAMICGSATGLTQPAGLTLDRKLRIYIAGIRPLTVSRSSLR